MSNEYRKIKYSKIKEILSCQLDDGAELLVATEILDDKLAEIEEHHLSLENINELLKEMEWLSDYGFKLYKIGTNEAEYIKRDYSIEIFISPYEHEVEVFFYIGKSTNIYMLRLMRQISLEYVLDYYKLKEFLPAYQYFSSDNIKQGLEYMSKVIIKVLDLFGTSGKRELSKISRFAMKQMVELTKENELEYDLNTADRLWSEKRFDEASELYEKREKNLSKLQVARLKFYKLKNGKS